MNPILPIALLGGGALLFLGGKKKDAPAGSPPPGGGGLPDLSHTTPGIAPGTSGPKPMDTTLKTAIANALKGLGIDPATGAVTGRATPEAIESATALASMLEAQGYTDAANALRAYATRAAQNVQVDTPEPIRQLPASLSQQLARALSLEGDPKRIRALVAQVKASEWGSNPQVMATLAALEARATQLEKEQDAARTALDVEEILKTPDDFTLPKTTPIVVPPPVVPVEPPAPTTPATYTVQTGDNPSKVAAKFTGDPERWRELQAANTRYNFQKQFWTGMVLTLPPSWRGGSAPSPAPVVTAPRPAVTVPTASPAPSGPRTHTVKTGEYPALLAKQYTGDGNRWRELDRANPRYDLTKQFWSGMVLTLPEGW